LADENHDADALSCLRHQYLSIIFSISVKLFQNQLRMSSLVMKAVSHRNQAKWWLAADVAPKAL